MMNFLQTLLTLSDTIPDRKATWQESLELIGVGWGSIFLVIAIVIVVIIILNKMFTKKK